MNFGKDKGGDEGLPSHRSTLPIQLKCDFGWRPLLDIKLDIYDRRKDPGLREEIVLMGEFQLHS